MAAAVLLRAAAVETGLDVARARRGASIAPAALARGPGNLCSALGITMDDNGIDLFDADSPVRLTPRDAQAGVRPRVGVSKAADRPWRFWLAGRQRRCRLTGAARGRRRPAPATRLSPAGRPSREAPSAMRKIYDCGRERSSTS